MREFQGRHERRSLVAAVGAQRPRGLRPKCDKSALDSGYVGTLFAPATLRAFRRTHMQPPREQAHKKVTKRLQAIARHAARLHASMYYTLEDLTEVRPALGVASGVRTVVVRRCGLLRRCGVHVSIACCGATKARAALLPQARTDSAQRNCLDSACGVAPRQRVRSGCPERASWLKRYHVFSSTQVSCNLADRPMRALPPRAALSPSRVTKLGVLACRRTWPCRSAVLSRCASSAQSRRPDHARCGSAVPAARCCGAYALALWAQP